MQAKLLALRLLKFKIGFVLCTFAAQWTTQAPNAAEQPASPIYKALASKAQPGKTQAADAAKWSPWLEFGGYWSSERSRGEAALFAPLWQNSEALIFTDFRGKLFEENVLEGNFALGFRRMLASGWNVGVWGGYDVRRSEHGSLFPQVSGGIELLRDNFDLRFNGYLPLTSEKSLSSIVANTYSAQSVALVGSNLFMTTAFTTTTTARTELALWGVDGEAGFKVPTPRSLDFGYLRQELRLYVGGFYFDHADLPGEVAGPKARVEWRLDNILASLPGSRLTLEGEWRNDAIRGTAYEAGARLRIPFGGAATRTASLTPQERRMTEALERDTDIVSQQQTATSTTSGTIQEGVIDSLTNVPLNNVEIVNAGGSISTASTTAGANSLILVRGDPIATVLTHTLQGNQTLLGSGTALTVHGATSGAVATFTDPGATPTVRATDTILVLDGSNTHAVGLAILSHLPGQRGMQVNAGHTNVVIDRVDITDAGSSGMVLLGSNGVRIVDTTITNSGSSGIWLAGSNITVDILRTTIDTAGTNAIRLLGASNTAIMLNDSTFTGNFGNNGLDIDGVHSGLSINGAGNTAAGANFPAGNLCDDGGMAWSGTVVFDGAPISSANCP